MLQWRIVYEMILLLNYLINYFVPGLCRLKPKILKTI